MEPGKIIDGWYVCRCGQKLFKIRSETRLRHFVCYCRKCKVERIINLEDGKASYAIVLKSQSQ